MVELIVTTAHPSDVLWFWQIWYSTKYGTAPNMVPHHPVCY